MKKIGIIGLGHQGTIHFKACKKLELVTDLKIEFLCDLHQTLQDETIPCYTDLVQALDNHDITHAIIATPHKYHFGICKLLLSNGIEVLKEKPYAFNEDESKKLDAICKQNDSKIYVVQQRYFDQDYQKLINLAQLTNGINFIEYRFLLNDNKAKSWYWEVDELGGCWYGLGWHACSVVSLFKDKFQSSSFDQICMNKRDWNYLTDDTCIIKLKFDTNSHALIHLSVTANSKQEFLALHGPDGAVEFDRKEIRHFDKNGTLLTSFLRNKANQAKSYEDQIMSFINRDNDFFGFVQKTNDLFMNLNEKASFSFFDN